MTVRCPPSGLGLQQIGARLLFDQSEHPLRLPHPQGGQLHIGLGEMDHGAPAHIQLLLPVQLGQAQPNIDQRIPALPARRFEQQLTHKPAEPLNSHPGQQRDGLEQGYRQKTFHFVRSEFRARASADASDGSIAATTWFYFVRLRNGAGFRVRGGPSTGCGTRCKYIPVRLTAACGATPLRYALRLRLHDQPTPSLARACAACDEHRASKIGKLFLDDSLVCGLYIDGN